MRFLFGIWIFILPITSWTKSQDWKEFNSSLLIEVTRPHGIFTCSGVAVSSKIILTAAHCLDGKIERVRVFTQDYYDPKADYYEVEKFKIHPRYEPSHSHYFADVAKIVLKDKLPKDIHIFPIFQKREITVSFLRFGYGSRHGDESNKKYRNPKFVITPELKEVDLDKATLELNDMYSYSGDSGGPVFLTQNNETYLVAVHSTLSYGPRGKYSYNPLLGSYVDWIFSY